MPEMVREDILAAMETIDEHSAWVSRFVEDDTPQDAYDEMHLLVDLATETLKLLLSCEGVN